jgi:DNA-binding LacI/PurR family transcriptional regulator
VVGYDDSRIARLSFVDLTTIRQDATQMAELAVEAAAQRLDEGRTTARDIVVKPTLIVRGSTGPARPLTPSAPPLAHRACSTPHGYAR